MNMNILGENLHTFSVLSNAKNYLLPNIYLGTPKTCRKKR